MILRKPDWPTRLHRFLESRRDTPYVWGFNDCAIFVCDAIQEMTGVDLAYEVRGRYSNKSEAEALLPQGLPGYAEHIAHYYALPDKGWRHLGRGDVALVQSEGEFSLAIILLSGKELAIQGPNGIEVYSVRIARRGWGIG
jgi:hypothetical protein